MKVLVATDAWRPQVNGVVRTLNSLARAAAKLGVDESGFCLPDCFSEHLVTEHFLPREARKASRLEYPHIPPRPEL